MCTLKKRPRVYQHHAYMFQHMCAWCRHTRGRFECTHGGVFESTHGFFSTFFSACRNTHTNTHHDHQQHHEAQTGLRSLFLRCEHMDESSKRPSAGRVAMRRRQRRLRSWWRHEQRSVAVALAAATHHSAPRSGWPEQHNSPRRPTTASAMEVEAHDPRGQEQLPPGVRPAPLPEVAGPQAAVTVGYVAAGAPSLAVVLVSDMLHDDATVQFLLQQSLLARSQEEEEAREQEEDKRQEEAVVTRMLRLEAEVMKYAGRDRSQLSDLEKAAVTLVAHSDALRRRRERRRSRGRSRGRKKFLVLLVLVVDVPVFINDKFQQFVFQL